MDVGMLFDMDNLETTILPASYRSAGRTPLPSSNDSSAPKVLDIPRTPRAHLHPMTNIDEPQYDSGLWDRNVQPHKQWSQPQESQFSTFQNLKARTANQLCPSAPSVQYPDLPSCPPVSFPVLQEPYDIKSTPTSSPAQARDDLQWQMYLTASLSNPLNTLQYPDPNSSPLSYSTGRQEIYGANTSLPIDSALFPASNSSAFSLDQVPDIFSTPPFVDSVPQMPSAFSSPPAITASHSHHSFSGFGLPQQQQQQDMPAEDPNARVVLPNGTYASLLGLTPLENYEMNSTLFVSPSGQNNLGPAVTPSPHGNSSPARRRGLSEGFVSPSHARGRRGLSGWNCDYQLKVPPATAGSFPTALSNKRRRSASVSPSANVRRPYQASPLSSTTTPGDMLSSSHQSKRRRPPPSSQTRDFALEDDESDGEANNPADDSESDDYRPSRSPTPVDPSERFGFGGSRGRGGFSLEHRLVAPSPTKKKSRRGKGKAKGSAALALAVVTQLGSKAIQARSGGYVATGNAGQIGIDGEEFDAMTLYQEGRTGIRKRKNNPIPLPIPIPNLNKKSRGRKVPFVADLSLSNAESIRRSASVLSVDSLVKSEGADEAGNIGTSSLGYAPRTSGRAKCPGGSKRTSNSNPAPVVDDAGCRTYVCVIPGCGKCFVRGEHLKRHVRSIHTHDKPHPCPYEGCDKSFSRRDNLGQHVRIHLQP